MKKVLVTGAVGFIGFHLTKKLLSNGISVYGIDNMNSYYDVSLKNSRLNLLKEYDNFIFKNLDISDFDSVTECFSKNNFSFIFHLAAQAGVRYSFENPQIYIDSNIKGFINILESCKSHKVDKLFYASSSSVYGDSSKGPLIEDMDLRPISLYGLTKKFNEDIASKYYDIYDINSIGLRFFTVYGPWGRPDMAYYKFTKNILSNNSINIYNNGKHSRSFTYIDDVINSIYKLYELYEMKEKYNEIFNIGGGESVKLNRFINIIEKMCNTIAIKRYIKKQKGDVEDTNANCSKIFNEINYSPNTDIVTGLELFFDWYKNYYD